MSLRPKKSLHKSKPETQTAAENQRKIRKAYLRHILRSKRAMGQVLTEGEKMQLDLLDSGIVTDDYDDSE